ncbi:hypothetical protein LTR78_002386 [Recurvomyces mirabilis]|uniref:Uncharacterized protein n=1 Tax=Recurvomyces mirabilis TaxID=574656 RepID=A0AAE1C4E3_9PEZI|nr:hypothetical protein LTR78_002386 [Recurvomyces mirabilis]KAK5157315.1 hypothetical protein LTS14_004080 [Recurvomyces mirabilis]
MSNVTGRAARRRRLISICLSTALMLLLLTVFIFTAGLHRTLPPGQKVDNGLNRRFNSSDITRRYPGADETHGSASEHSSTNYHEWESITEANIETYAEKGRNLLELIASSAEQASEAMSRARNRRESSQSPYTSKKDLLDNGWSSEYVAPGWKPFTWAGDAPIDEALEQMHISTHVTTVGRHPPAAVFAHGGDVNMPDMGSQHQTSPSVDISEGSHNPNDGPNFAVNWVHSHETKHGESQQIYHATGGVYGAVYNVKDGLIMAAYSTSPEDRIIDSESAVHHLHPDAVAPPLHFWSDVAYIEYLDRAKSEEVDVSRLTSVFQVKVNNVYTRPLVLFLLQKHLGKAVTDFPNLQNRVIWSMDSEAGRALLGSPNGAGVAWLLIQHKETLGQKRIKNVIVYVDKWQREEAPRSHNHLPNLIFELEDVQAEMATPKSKKPKPNTGAGVSKPQKKPPGGSGGPSGGSGSWTGRLRPPPPAKGS